ncbi:vWA domain-containing protein [Paraliomyxa miuraensis]|uniref:vWA domain-containing protein n=1 Tax=Paraliomyxa miuraensis TaxID=376150 RepID=UPI002255AA42|nr:vWA domain-containing protein [Paraliomyxa miuraensis]MCX4240970.1 VWA domain-containing protein [Paraliomyxa miuraensis]
MKRLDLTPILISGLAVGMMSLACGKPDEDEDDTTTGVISITITATESMGMTSIDPDDTGDKLDVGGGATDTTPGCNTGDVGCTDQIDLLFVIDNSGTMGEEQINLARNFPLLIQRLENLTDSSGMAVNPDVHIMVTTSDFGNPLCTPFEPMGYDPARGAPISTACTTRLQDFTDLTMTNSVPEACTNLCPAPVQPDGDYIAFSINGDNIPDSVVETDINGDGTPDSPAAQALACIGPQGVNGCGYESQLENMLQALNPAATWNQGTQPFLREGALLAVAMVTDEADCSVKDYSIMENAAFHNVNPDSGMTGPSSAICWNAGVSCTGPDAMGVFSECHSRDAEDLQPIERYTNYLINELRENQGKEVIMLGILGVPLVTAHNPDPPFQPTAGGVMTLEYRNWRDGQYPVGDILPDEFAMGESAADKQFDFGIGPGCTGQDSLGAFTGQAIPPVRIKEVCESLNLANGDIRCCIESICDDDFSPAIECLTGIIQESIQLPG